MIKPTKRKVKKVAKRKNPRSTYNFTGLITDVIDDDLESYLGKKVEAKFEFGKKSGGEISGKLEQNSDGLYFVTNSGNTKISTSYGFKRSEKSTYLYFHIEDIGLIDPNPTFGNTPLILIGKKLTEKYLTR